jgi:hypothetical protein
MGIIQADTESCSTGSIKHGHFWHLMCKLFKLVLLDVDFTWPHTYFHVKRQNMAMFV